MATPIRIVKVSDRRLAKIANELASEIGNSKITISYIGDGSETVDNVDLRSCSESSYAISRIDVFVPNANQRITICRGQFKFPSNYNGSSGVDHSVFVHSRVSAPFDEYIVLGHGQITQKTAREIDRIFAEVRIEPIDSGVDAGAYSDILLSQLDQLRALSLEFHKKQVEAEEGNIKILRSREQSLEARFTKKEAELKKERQDLEDYRKKVNDREPQHERRALRKSLTGDLRAALFADKTESTKDIYTTFNLYFIFALFFIVLSVFFSYLSLGKSGSDLIIGSIKSALSGIAAAAFAWAGLSGRRDAALADRTYEKSVRRYAFDMDRASWIVETILQMNSMERSQIPDEWLKSVCTNLFELEGDQGDQERSSLESLAALLDVTAKANIGTNGIDFEIDRKGAKKLAAE